MTALLLHFVFFTWPGRILAIGLILLQVSWYRYHDAHPTPLAPACVQVSLDGPMTPTTWAQALLCRLGDPVSPENVRAIVAWERAEGGNWNNRAQFNPLNTTMPEPASLAINAVGVQAYINWDEGLQATIETITNGRYGGVLAALRAGDCAACVAAAVGASPWGTGRFAV